MDNISETKRTMLQSIYTICVNPENRPPEEIFIQILGIIDITENINNENLPPFMKEIMKPDPEAVNELKELLRRLFNEYPTGKVSEILKEKIKSILINEYYGSEEILNKMVKDAYLKLLTISPMQIEM